MHHSAWRQTFRCNDSNSSPVMMYFLTAAADWVYSQRAVWYLSAWHGSLSPVLFPVAVMVWKHAIFQLWQGNNRIQGVLLMLWKNSEAAVLFIYLSFIMFELMVNVCRGSVGCLSLNAGIFFFLVHVWLTVRLICYQASRHSAAVGCKQNTDILSSCNVHVSNMLANRCLFKHPAHTQRH